MSSYFIKEISFPSFQSVSPNSHSFLPIILYPLSFYPKQQLAGTGEKKGEYENIATNTIPIQSLQEPT